MVVEKAAPLPVFPETIISLTLILSSIDTLSFVTIEFALINNFPTLSL